MKKLLFLPLTLMLLGTLAACGGDESPEMAETSQTLSNDVSSCYQIFPIAFADSNNDGYGDLEGITENAEYLTDTLDVDCVWLNPINPSPSYHKYDVTDYYDIDEQFGTMEDFEAFLDVMHDNDILVLTDFVINHTSYNHPWFESARDDGEYRDWYRWHDFDDSDEDYPSMDGWYQHNDAYYYASFWDQMPELNYENEAVREEIKNIATYWLEDVGVDGFRIDAARHIYDKNEYPSGTDVDELNIEWFLEFNDHVKSINDDAVILSEVWVESSSYIADFYEGMDTTFNFQTATDIMDAVSSTRDNDMVENLVEAREAYGEVREDFVDSMFLTNHDQNRVMSELSEDEDKARLAANILFTLPGVSWVYYGEEIGMNGQKPDESIRQPFKWGGESEDTTEAKPDGINAWGEHNTAIDGVAAQRDDEGSLLNHYRELISLKKSDDTLRDGDIAELPGSDYEGAIEDEGDVMSYLRTDGDTTYLVIHHLGGSPSAITHSLPDHSVVYSSDDYTESGDAFELQAHASIILELND